MLDRGAGERGHRDVEAEIVQQRCDVAAAGQWLSAGPTIYPQPRGGDFALRSSQGAA
jgi:hypothetical protein